MIDANKATWITRNKLTAGARPYFANIYDGNKLAVHSWAVATIAKVSGGFTVTPIADCPFDIEAVTAKTRKAAIETFVVAYVAELSKPVDPATIDRSLKPCPYCGHIECASRFDCNG